MEPGTPNSLSTRATQAGDLRPEGGITYNSFIIPVARCADAIRPSFFGKNVFLICGAE